MFSLRVMTFLISKKPFHAMWTSGPYAMGQSTPSAHARCFPRGLRWAGSSRALLLWAGKVGQNSIDRGLLSDGRTLALPELNQLHKYAGMLSLCASSDKLPASICSFTALRCFGEKVGYNFSIVSFDDRVTYGQQKCYNINQNL